MKRILITGTVLASNDESKKVYEEIINIIGSSDYEIFSPLDTMKFAGNDREKYERAMKLVKDTNLIIAEASSVSTGQGMELQEAVHFNIPILVIAKNGSKVSGLVKGCPNVGKIVYYDKIDDIRNILIDYIREN